jgi:Ion channel
MIGALLLSFLALVSGMLVQVGVVVLMLRFLSRRLVGTAFQPGFLGQTGILISVLCVLFAGHLIQIAIWAFLYVRLDEFDDFATSFYHSTVNFATLGYGDIIMSQRWRLLGALQAASGVLMFGLSTGTLFAVMSHIFWRSRNASSQTP